MYTAGIIPSVPPVNATIVGAVGMELYKIIQGFENTIDYNNASINLSTPSFLFTQPEQPRETKDSEFDPLMMCPVKAIPVRWTIWDTIEVTGPMTVQEFFDKIKADYNVVATLLFSGTTTIYNNYIPNKKHEPRLERKIEDIHAEVGKLVEGRTYIELEVSGETVEDSIDAIMPKFKYIFA